MKVSYQQQLLQLLDVFTTLLFVSEVVQLTARPCL